MFREESKEVTNKNRTITLQGQVERVSSGGGVFVYNNGIDFVEILIPIKFLKEIDAGYNGAQIDIQVIKSKRHPIWNKSDMFLKLLMKKFNNT